MHKVLLLTALGAVLFALPVHAQHAFTGSSFIFAGHPGTSAGAGIVEIVSPCTPSSPITGLDGAWFNIAGFGTIPQHGAVLTMAATLDANAYFYRSVCSFIGPGDGDCSEAFIGATETCDVPFNAAFVVVNGALGSGSFTLSIS